MEKSELSQTSHGAVESKDGDGDAPPQRSMNPYAWFALISGVLFATFTFAFDNTIVANVQPRIIRDLGHIEKLPWITVAFQLGTASANLLWSKLYGKFEHKTLFLVSLVMFEVGSAVCGAAPTMNALIVGRIISGLGGNGVYIGTLNIMTDLTTIQERPLYISFFGLTWSIGTVVGPVIGGAFTANPHAGWRWSFYINICIFAAFAPVYLFLLPTHSPVSGQSVTGRLRSIDWLGVVLVVGAFASGVMAISFGGTLYRWSSARIIVLFCMSGLLWVLFALQQAFSVATSPAERIFPVHLLRSYENCIYFAQSASSLVTLFVPVYLIPLYFQFVHGDTPLESGVRLLPYICAAITFCMLSGGLLAKTQYMPWFLGGSAAVIVGAALMHTAGVHTAHGAIYGFSVILGVGVGCYVQASIPIAQAKHDPSESSNVLALLSTAQVSGLTAAFSIAYAIFINLATRRLRHVLPDVPQDQIQAAIAGVETQIFYNLPAAEEERVLTAITSSIADVYWQIMAGGALSFILALFMKREKLFPS